MTDKDCVDLAYTYNHQFAIMKSIKGYNFIDFFKASLFHMFLLCLSPTLYTISASNQYLAMT